MAKLEPTDNFGLQGWMVTELGLAGYELVAYALVHQFSMKSKAGMYTGGVPYLASWLSCTLETARKYLHQLEEKGLIIAKRGTNDGVPYCYYQVVDNQIPKILRDATEDFRGDTQNFKGGTPKKIGVEYKEEYKAESNIPPTPQEVVDYCREQGFRDPIGFADYYLRCQTANQWRKKSGEPIVNWKLNIQQWRKYHKDDTFPHPNPEQFTATNDQINAYLR